MGRGRGAIKGWLLLGRRVDAIEQAAAALAAADAARAEALARIEASLAELAAGVVRLGAPEIDHFALPVEHRKAALTAAALVLRGLRLSDAVDLSQPRPVATPEPFEAYLAQLEALDPTLFPLWRRLFDNARRSYVQEPEASCSHREHHHALLFRAYLDVHAHGRILDIGCGPNGVPSYLAGRDARLLAGIDPLEPTAPPPFERVRGFNEFLPWPDDSFDAVVSGTSLDHVLSLPRSLAEVRRVLRPGGRYLVWLASIPGAAPFDPTAEPFVPVDDFHLFHFDRAWIEPVLDEVFEIEDITVIAQPGFDHVFYCLTPRA